MKLSLAIAATYSSIVKAYGDNEYLNDNLNGLGVRHFTFNGGYIPPPFEFAAEKTDSYNPPQGYPGHDPSYSHEDHIVDYDFANPPHGQPGHVHTYGDHYDHLFQDEIPETVYVPLPQAVHDYD